MKPATAAAVLLVALGACGGVADKRECLVKIYFQLDASQTQIAAVRTHLEADSRVRSVVFLSADAALERMRKKYPELVAGLTYNPLPDQLEATFEDEHDAAEIVDTFVPAFPGVENVRDGCALRDAD